MATETIARGPYKPSSHHQSEYSDELYWHMMDSRDGGEWGTFASQEEAQAECDEWNAAAQRARENGE